MAQTGPTQGAERHADSVQRWKSHPRLAAVLRVLVFVAPITLSLMLTWAGAKWLPPERLGINRWTWIIGAFIIANSVLIVTAKATRRLTPLVALLKLSLVFPDNAPPRAKAMLRKSNSRKLVRDMEQARARGERTGETNHGVLLVHLLRELNNHDRLTRGHSERVRAYSELIGEELDLPEEDMQKLRWASLLHDVGKLDVPSEILNKDGRPDDTEWKILQTHPAAGGVRLEELRPWLGEWVHAADQHHLRWDGLGYPSNLSGTDISLPGRLVAVADSYDVMTSARSYKKPLSYEVARHELTACAGTQFDPAIVRAFLNVGLGRIRAIVGPVSWAANALGSLQVPAPVISAVGTGIAAAASVTVATFGGLPSVDSPPDALGAVAPVMAEDVSVDAVEDEPAEIVLTATGGTGDISFSIGTPQHGNMVLGAVQLAQDELDEVSEQTARSVTYVPHENYSGLDSFGFEACDSEGRCDAGSGIITVSEVNDAPIAAGVFVSAIAGETYRLDVPPNDVDVEGSEIRFVDVLDFAGGTADIVSGRIELTPDPSFEGSLEIRYVIGDDGGAEAIGTIVAVVTIPNRPPSASPDVATTAEDGAVVIDVLGNDTDPDGDALELVAVTKPANGVAKIVDGRVRYTPAADYHGGDSFEYRINDGRNPEVSSTVSVSIASVNDAPIVTAPSVTVPEDATPGSVLTTVTATDTEGDPITFSIGGGDPTGRFSIDPVTGFVTLAAPLDYESGSSYPLRIEVRDGFDVTSVFVTVTIMDIDEAPIAVADTFSVAEDSPTDLPLDANDADPEGATLTFDLPGASTAGGTVAFADGVVSYTPPLDYTGPDSFNYTVSDPAGNTSDPVSVSIVVTQVNDAPELGAIGPQIGEEGTPLTFVATAVDSNDSPADVLSYSLAGTVPTGATIDPSTGDFTWTPTETQDGSYSFDVVVTDNGIPSLSDSETITVTVNEINTAPVLAAIGPQTGDELTLISFTATATDSDLPANTLTYSLAGTVPAGATIDPSTGGFTWTPTETQDGSYSFDVVVTDSGTLNLTHSETVAFTINEINTAPVLAAIGPQTGDELTVISFTATATDSDLPANTLTYSLAGTVPAGATIDPSTGGFTWTPTEAQDGSYSFDVVVTDSGTLNLTHSETVAFTINETNTAPVLAAIGPQTGDELTVISFTATATDSDLPANTLTYSLAGTVPAGATIDPSTGGFTWTPTEAQDGSYSFDVVVTDSGTPNLTHSETITITVNEINTTPVLAAIGPQTGDELTVISFTATATDTDVPADVLAYSLAGVVPAGAAIDPTTGDFTWTPAEAQDGSYSFDVVVTDDGTPNLTHSETITITVNEINTTPVLAAIGPQTGDELTVISFTATATDTDIPANTLTYSLAGTVPTGATIDPSTGDFTWTPTETQAGGYSFDVVVTDDGTPNLTHSETVAFTINEANTAPVLAAIGPKSADELTVLTFTAAATDTDIPANTLTYSLAGTVPTGATIDPSTGDFTWTPTETQDGAYSFDVVVTDDGTPNLTHSETVAFTIAEANTAPALAVIPSPTTAAVGQAFSVTTSATDTDLPTQTLGYSISGLPGWAGWVDNGDGTATMSGTPPIGSLGSSTVTVSVDDGSLSDSQTFVLDVTMAISPQYGDLLINELLYEQRPGFTEEFVELYNASSAPIDLTGWNLASQNNQAGDPIDLDYVFPAADELARPALLPASAYAVIWTQTRGGAEVAPLAALEFAMGEGLVFDNDGEEIFLFDPGGEVVDYTEYGDRLNPLADFGTAPPAAIWTDAYSDANQLVGGPGQSMALTPNGSDADHSACWEATGSGDAGGRPECTTAPVTIDTDPTARVATPGSDNNSMYVASPLAGQIVVNEVYMRTIVGEPEEFVELHNVGPTAVDLTGLRVIDSNRFVGEIDTNTMDVFLPALDVSGTPSILPSGGHAVVWVSQHLGTLDVDAPLADLQFESGTPFHWALDDSDEIWVLDPGNRIVDFVAWGSGGELGTPPPFGWDPSYQTALDMPANGQTISLTPNGTDTDLSACWEHTGSGQAGLRPECSGQPTTIDSDPVPFRVTSVGRSNN